MPRMGNNPFPVWITSFFTKKAVKKNTHNQLINSLNQLSGSPSHWQASTRHPLSSFSLFHTSFSMPSLLLYMLFLPLPCLPLFPLSFFTFVLSLPPFPRLSLPFHLSPLLPTLCLSLTTSPASQIPCSLCWHPPLTILLPLFSSLWSTPPPSYSASISSFLFPLTSLLLSSISFLSSFLSSLSAPFCYPHLTSLFHPFSILPITTVGMWQICSHLTITI